jgi:hypothetical protein
MIEINNLYPHLSEIIDSLTNNPSNHQIENNKLQNDKTDIKNDELLKHLIEELKKLEEEKSTILKIKPVENRTISQKNRLE